MGLINRAVFFRNKLKSQNLVKTLRISIGNQYQNAKNSLPKGTPFKLIKKQYWSKKQSDFSLGVFLGHRDRRFAPILDFQKLGQNRSKAIFRPIKFQFKSTQIESKWVAGYNPSAAPKSECSGQGVFRPPIRARAKAST